MATVYPGGYDAFDPAGPNLDTNPHSEMHNDVQDSVTAVQTTLGLYPQGSFGSVRARLDGSLPEDKQAWLSLVLFQGVTVFSTVATGWYQRSRGSWSAQISATASSAGSAGSPIAIAPPFTLASAENIGGSFTVLDAGSTVYAGSIYPHGTTEFRLQCDQSSDRLGANPAFTLAAGDILRLTLHGFY